VEQTQFVLPVQFGFRQNPPEQTKSLLQFEFDPQVPLQVFGVLVGVGVGVGVTVGVPVGVGVGVPDPWKQDPIGILGSQIQASMPPVGGDFTQQFLGLSPLYWHSGAAAVMF
jgi:hypothetical protein